MSAYFAPAFFSHLLGKCLRRQNPILSVLKLGIAVVVTFVIVWWPYLHSVDDFLMVNTHLIILNCTSCFLLWCKLHISWLVYLLINVNQIADDAGSLPSCSIWEGNIRGLRSKFLVHHFHSHKMEKTIHNTISQVYKLSCNSISFFPFNGSANLVTKQRRFSIWLAQ